jgi:hypothetical protein
LIHRYAAGCPLLPEGSPATAAFVAPFERLHSATRLLLDQGWESFIEAMNDNREGQQSMRPYVLPTLSSLSLADEVTAARASERTAHSFYTSIIITTTTPPPLNTHHHHLPHTSSPPPPTTHQPPTTTHHHPSPPTTIISRYPGVSAHLALSLLERYDFTPSDGADGGTPKKTKKKEVNLTHPHFFFLFFSFFPFFFFVSFSLFLVLSFSCLFVQHKTVHLRPPPQLYTVVYIG